MPTKGTPIGFGIYDLLTRVTPGAIFLIIAFGSLAFNNSIWPNQHVSLYLILFAVLSLVTGEAINHVAGVLYVPPTSFTRFLYEQDVDVELGLLDSLRRRSSKVSEGRSFVTTVTGDDFWPLFTSHFRIDEDYNNAWDVYHLLLGYMEPRLSSRTRRQQTIFHFVNNTIFAIGGGVVFVVLKFVQEFVSGNLSGITIVWSLLATFLSVLVVFTLILIFGYQESEYVSNLVIEYYIDRVGSGDVDNLSERAVQATLDNIETREN